MASFVYSNLVVCVCLYSFLLILEFVITCHLFFLDCFRIHVGSLTEFGKEWAISGYGLFVMEVECEKEGSVGIY